MWFIHAPVFLDILSHSMFSTPCQSFPQSLTVIKSSQKYSERVPWKVVSYISSEVQWKIGFEPKFKNLSCLRDKIWKNDSVNLTFEVLSYLKRTKQILRERSWIVNHPETENHPRIFIKYLTHLLRLRFFFSLTLSLFLFL